MIAKRFNKATVPTYFICTPISFRSLMELPGWIENYLLLRSFIVTTYTGICLEAEYTLVAFQTCHTNRLFIIKTKRIKYYICLCIFSVFGKMFIYFCECRWLYKNYYKLVSSSPILLPHLYFRLNLNFFYEKNKA